jgi:hopanoid biosynthesis associated protein HpnK
MGCDPQTGHACTRLIVNADDFGRSHSRNQAIIQAHQKGILTSASLMPGGEAFDEAVDLARTHPRLGVGLHVTLVCGRAVLPPERIPGLADARGRFNDNAVRAGMDFFFKRALQSQLREEIAAQFERFAQTGLKLDHVNGHLNIHLHPTIFKILMAQVEKTRFAAFRLTRDWFWMNARMAPGQWLYRTSHALIFTLLSRRAQPALRRAGIRHTRAVFGLLQTARVTEQYLLDLLPRLPAGDFELYSHPCLEDAPEEYAALVSPRVMGRMRTLGIQPIRYQDL